MMRVLLNRSSSSNNNNDDNDEHSAPVVLHHESPGIIHITDHQVNANKGIRNNKTKFTMRMKVTSLLSLAIVGIGLITWGASAPTATADSHGGSTSSISRRSTMSNDSGDVVHVQMSYEQDRLHHYIHNEGALDSNNNKLNVWMTGLVNDAASMTDDTFNFLMEWHCEMGAHVHFMVQEGAVTLLKRRANYIEEQNRRSTSIGAGCSSAIFKVVTQEPDLSSIYPNRIDRLAHLRDVQRDEVRALSKQANNNIIDAIIVMDGDLHSVPNARYVHSQLVDMLHDVSSSDGDRTTGFDVVCAAGVNHDSNIFSYYDTFATILEPDTWVYPLRWRLEHNDTSVSAKDLVQRANQLHPEEDLSLVIETGTTSQELLQYIQTHATTPLSTSAFSSKVLPVKSCFGGMAVYRASTWLDSPCTYSEGTSKRDVIFSEMELRSYANKDDERSCEHVTFHQCLTEQSKTTKIALHPSLVTEYHDVQDMYHSEYSFHSIAEEERRERRDLGGEDPIPAVPVLMTGTDPYYVDFSASSYYNATSSGRNGTQSISPVSVCTCMFHLEILTDYFPFETSYELIRLTDTESEVILTNTDPLEKSKLQGPDDICLPEGTYIFVILDSYGDGIFKPGKYEIDVCGGDITRSGGGSDNRWSVDRTVFLVTADGNAEYPPEPEPYTNGVLVARTSANQCAEAMGWGPYGEFADKIAGQDGFMCTDCDDLNGEGLLHTQWMQIFYDLGTEIMRIMWTFKDAKTLEKRFDTAYQKGEYVTWSIWEASVPDVEHTKTGKWYFSTGFNGWPTEASGTRGFSKDDGAWGAADEDVNGDRYSVNANNQNVPDGFWGQGNFNGGDGLCGTYYREGKEMKLETGALWSELYVVTETIKEAEPTPSPTEAPTMAPTPTQDCHFDVLITTDGWGSETSWSLRRIDGGVGSESFAVDVEAGSYGNYRQYRYTNSCLDPGVYEFTLYDSGNDGIFPPFGVHLFVGGVFKVNFWAKDRDETSLSEEKYTFEILGSSDNLF